MQPSQTPQPGAHILQHRGDVVEFRLTLSNPRKGDAWLRTNIGNGHIRRQEIISHIENNTPLLARDWHDIQMFRGEETTYSLKMPLLDEGTFEAKAFFLPEGTDEPVWPFGGNTIVKVDPAEYCSCNMIYNAFVRQFGPNKWSKPISSDTEGATQLLEKQGFNVIPRSGTFRDLMKELDFIIGKLHFRIIQLLPIHPTPTTFARMGRFGSPYAVLNFRTVDRGLAEFDKKTTPMDQFRELVNAIHERHDKLFLDIPVNHTGWASSLQIEHPEWFARGHDREFESPGAWGVTWADLSKLDYSHKELWLYMGEVFLHWCRQGVDGFRCDAGYMIPAGVWEYIVAKVRNEYPETVFLLEGLGGDLNVMEHLLSSANLNWAYSELFQNYTQSEIEWYLPGAVRISSTKGLLVHFAETHDNNRLAARSKSHSRLRTALSAMCSQNGAFGITNGVEFFAEEKIDVHEARSLSWGNSENQVEHLVRLNAILESHPAFHSGAVLRLIPHDGRDSIALLRRASHGGDPILVLANINEEKPVRIHWSAGDFHSAGTMHDLISGRDVHITTEHEKQNCHLEPAEVLCLTTNRADMEKLALVANRAPAIPRNVEMQQLRAKAFDVWRHFNGNKDISGLNTFNEAEKLRSDPRAYCASLAMDIGQGLTPVTGWEWPRDVKRTVMLPPGHFLLVRAPSHFLVELIRNDSVLRHESSLTRGDGSHFALILPLDEPDAPVTVTLSMVVHDPAGLKTTQSPLLCLPASHNARVSTVFDRQQALDLSCYALCTNGRGAMSTMRAAWGEIRSKYDAILAANLHPAFPVDRHVMFTRCRAWLNFRGYSHEINRDCLTRFSAGEGGEIIWDFEVPSGMGKFIRLVIVAELQHDRNCVSLLVSRLKADIDPECLDDEEPIKIILRADMEDRSCHETTKAFTGPESLWKHSVSALPNGFTFSPDPKRRIQVTVTKGTFREEHQWSYMKGTPFDADRGLDASTDLFSPGFFTIPLCGGDSRLLVADIPASAAAAPHIPENRRIPKVQDDASMLPIDATRRAMKHYIVKRDQFRTVVAGYPWFLDWGRDTLICLRGMIAAGFTKESRGILEQFARFEKDGTLPNMIRGDDDSNRDTSDAPLWFFVASSDLIKAGDHSLLKSDCGGRTMHDVLHSLATRYIKGTSNGIRMDPESGLIFSPSHFTWMDTNHPAGTPREGYPVEIQALWYFALKFMAELEPSGNWRALSEKVKASIRSLYLMIDGGFLSDCLHARHGTEAGKAVADDALRPNQLLAITLGAIEDKTICNSILLRCEELLVPGGIRSLADRPVHHPLSIQRNGYLLNDPHAPYWGEYRGDEDTRRKPAYHNGTAWTWLFPSYPEALFAVHGEEARETALSILSSSVCVINQDCITQVPEILDGNTPHTIRGCGAQAWGVTELHRVLAKLARS